MIRRSQNQRKKNQNLNLPMSKELRDNLKAMSDKDLKAIYAYIQSLGPKGEPAPAALSPGVAPDRPHIPFIPQMPVQKS